MSDKINDFERHYKDFDPLHEAELSSDKRVYYFAAQELLRNAAWKNELYKCKKKLYNELALRSNSDIEREGNRRALIALAEFENQINVLASKAEKPNPIKTLSDKL